MLLAHARASDAALLYPSAELSGAEAIYLQDPSLSTGWRVNGTSCSIDIDMGAAALWSLFALLNTNLTPTATLQLQAASSQAGLGASTTPHAAPVTALNSSDLAAWDWRPVFYYNTAGLNYQWLRATISDSANLDGFLHFGRLIYAAAFVPVVGLEEGARLTWLPDAAIAESRGGEEYATRRARRRQITARLPGLTQAEAMGFVFDQGRLGGDVDPILMMMDETDTAQWHRTSVYGRPVTRDLINRFAGSAGRWESELAVRETVDPSDAIDRGTTVWGNDDENWEADDTNWEDN